MVYKKTTEQFIADAKAKHGDKFDYSLVEYKHSLQEVTIICPIHGQFNQKATDHLRAKGCAKCSHTQRTTETFIEQAKSVHGDKFDYSKVNYINQYEKIMLCCNKHTQEFIISPKRHLRCNLGGCPSCVKEKPRAISIRKTLEHFIEDAKKVHGNIYDYSLVEYKNTNIKIAIICKVHGVFHQRPAAHLYKNGCPICAVDNSKTDLEEFIDKANKIHNNKFDYSNVDYKNTKTPVIINCPEHGQFKQRPKVHLNNLEVCRLCRYDNKLKTFIEKSKKRHNNKYDYSKVEYKRSSDKVIIICPIHGEFTQTIDNHLHYGCNCCAFTTGGIGINESEYFTPFLKNIIDKEIYCQYKIYNEKSSYFVDFYIPSINLVIEYDEKYHNTKKEDDKIRQEYIIKKLNCLFIRIDDKKFMKNNEYAKEIIYNYLKKVVDNLKKSL